MSQEYDYIIVGAGSAGNTLLEGNFIPRSLLPAWSPKT